MNKRVLFLAFGFSFAPALFQSTFAYVPPSSFIIKKVAALKSDLKIVGIETQIQRMEEEKPVGNLVREVLKVNFQSQSLEYFFKDVEGRELYRNFSKIENLESVGVKLLFMGGADRLERQLIGKKIPILKDSEAVKLPDEFRRREAESTRLARFQDLFLWVIGDLKSETSELWIEKDTFKPIRYLGLDQIEIRTSNYLNFQGLSYPKDQWILIQDKVVLHATSTPIAVFKDSGDFGWSEVAKESSSESRDLINNFLKFFR